MTWSLGAYLTMAGSLLIAIACGVAAYGIAIRQAKREIDEAFAEHIARMHREFLEHDREREG